MFNITIVSGSLVTNFITGFAGSGYEYCHELRNEYQALDPFNLIVGNLGYNYI